MAEGLTPIANGLLAEYVSSRFDVTDLSPAGSQLKIGTAQIIGLIAAGVAGGNPATGSLIGGTAEKYNDQGFHLDPTDQSNDDGLPPQNAVSDIDKLKAKISRLILTGLFPALLEEGAVGGFLGRITGMFSESTEGTALAGAGTKAGAGGAVEVAASTQATDGAAAAAAAAANAGKLRAQATAEEIAGGHAFDKHVVQKGEYRDLGITTREEFSKHIKDVVSNPTSFRELNGGRSAFWDEASGTVVIKNPSAVDGGTAFRPTNGRAYFDDLR